MDIYPDKTGVTGRWASETVCALQVKQLSGVCHLKLDNNCGRFFRLTRRKTAGMPLAFQGLSTKSDGKRFRKDCKLLGDTRHYSSSSSTAL